MWEKIKENAFDLNAFGIASGSLAIFLIMLIQGATYFYENIRWILWIEISWATVSILWALERLVKDLRE